jgi:hypothetical protein
MSEYLIRYQDKEVETSNYDVVSGVAIIRTLLNKDILIINNSDEPINPVVDYSLFHENSDYSNNTNCNRSHTVVNVGNQRYTIYYNTLDVLKGFKIGCELLGICYDNIVYYSNLLIL